MRNLLSLVGLTVIGFAVIGWYCGWYTLSVTKGTEGKPEIKTTFDTNKVADDSSSFFNRVGQALGEKMKRSDLKDGQPASAPGSTPGPIAPAKSDLTPSSGQGGWFLAPTSATLPKR